MALQYPLINGVAHSFASIEVQAGVLRFSAFKSINYSRTRTRGMLEGPHPDPMAKTRGTNAYKGDAELYLEQWRDFILSVGGEGYGDIPFQIVVNYSDFGVSTITDVLLGCTIDSTEASQSRGNDPLVRKVELSPLKILFNGTDDSLVPLVGASFL